MDDWYGLWMTGMADWHGQLAWMTGVHGLPWTEFYILITDRLTDGRTLVLVKLLSRLKTKTIRFTIPFKLNIP